MSETQAANILRYGELVDVTSWLYLVRWDGSHYAISANGEKVWLVDSGPWLTIE